jgi:hypothetical protein
MDDGRKTTDGRSQIAEDATPDDRQMDIDPLSEA